MLVNHCWGREDKEGRGREGNEEIAEGGMEIGGCREGKHINCLRCSLVLKCSFSLFLNRCNSNGIGMEGGREIL